MTSTNQRAANIEPQLDEALCVLIDGWMACTPPAVVMETSAQAAILDLMVINHLQAECQLVSISVSKSLWITYVWRL